MQKRGSRGLRSGNVARAACARDGRALDVHGRARQGAPPRAHRRPARALAPRRRRVRALHAPRSDRQSSGPGSRDHPGRPPRALRVPAPGTVNRSPVTGGGAALPQARPEPRERRRFGVPGRPALPGGARHDAGVPPSAARPAFGRRSVRQRSQPCGQSPRGLRRGGRSGCAGAARDDRPVEGHGDVPRVCRDGVAARRRAPAAPRGPGWRQERTPGRGCHHRAEASSRIQPALKASPAMSAPIGSDRTAVARWNRARGGAAMACWARASLT